jgi:hypothetical protein
MWLKKKGAATDKDIFTPLPCMAGISPQGENYWRWRFSGMPN